MLALSSVLFKNKHTWLLTTRGEAGFDKLLLLTNKHVFQELFCKLSVVIGDYLYYYRHILEK